MLSPELLLELLQFLPQRSHLEPVERWWSKPSCGVGSFAGTIYSGRTPCLNRRPRLSRDHCKADSAAKSSSPMPCSLPSLRSSPRRLQKPSVMILLCPDERGEEPVRVPGAWPCRRVRRRLFEGRSPLPRSSTAGRETGEAELPDNHLDSSWAVLREGKSTSQRLHQSPAAGLAARVAAIPSSASSAHLAIQP